MHTKFHLAPELIHHFKLFNKKKTNCFILEKKQNNHHLIKRIS